MRDIAGNGGPPFDVRAFGAAGDGETIDSAAINRVIEAAAKAGGGTVRIPAGNYLAYSIRLRSHVRLLFERGATLIAADPQPYATDTDGYDPPEPKTSAHAYQDFGHNHWHNSMVWGEDLEDVAIEGPGLIWGRGLPNGDFEPRRPHAMRHGVANKAIALKNCRGITLKGFSILCGGHFGVLATGVEDFRIQDLTIDTNRDGINLDCCRKGVVEGCRVNSPNDDGICLKSSYALGSALPTEDITIDNNFLAGGYRIGTFLTDKLEPISQDEAHANVTERTGRIKLGTESNGGFRRITITNNVFRSCRGIALETVDGGDLEDILVDGLEMYDLRTAPLFIRLGGRLRGPEGSAPGRMTGIKIRNVLAEQWITTVPAIINGMPGYRIGDVEITNFLMRIKGGGTPAMAALEPPEAEESYPDPECFGTELPACGLFARHIDRLALDNFKVECVHPDSRPHSWLQDIGEVRILGRGVVAQSLIRLESIGDLRMIHTRPSRPARGPARSPG